MSVSRWNPWRQARNDLFGEAFHRSRGEKAPWLDFPVDVRETDTGYLIQAALPGVRPEDLHLQVRENTLQITGHIEEAAEEHHARWLRRECVTGRFERTIRLPTDVEAEQAEAVLEHGVLTVRLPKVQQSQAHSISVRTSQPIVAQSQPTSQVAPEQTAMAQGSQVRPGMTVVGVEQRSIGYEVVAVNQDQHTFTIEQPGGSGEQLVVPFDAIQMVGANEVVLTVPIDQVRNQGWQESRRGS